MDQILANFVEKLKNTHWVSGGNWEFDWYIDCFFCQAMSCGDNPIFLGYKQPILGDQFLSPRQSVEDKIIGRLRKYCHNLDNIKKLTDKQDKINSSARALISSLEQGGVFDFDQYQQTQLDLSLLMASTSVAFDKIIEEEIIKIAKVEKISVQQLIQYFLSKSSDSALNDSNQALVTILKKYGKEIEDSNYNYQLFSDQLKIKLKKHVNTYGWINTGERGGQPWLVRDFIKQLKDLKNKQTINTPPIDFSLNKENQNFIDIYIKMSRNDNLASDYQVKLDYLFQGYLRKKLGDLYDEKILENLTFQEILKLVKNPKDIQYFKNRKNNYLRLVYPKDNKVCCYYFDSSDKFDEICSMVQTKKAIGTTISGMVACMGRVEGTVKIIMSKNDLNKIERGDVLVALKTQPSYVSAMVLASAIVTDIGGITSHAAIIAREFSVPCIVGTGNATKLLRDGDKVQVDAESGFIKKIS